MKREDLVAQGLTAEQIDFVLAEHSKELNPLSAERDNYKTQIGDLTTKLNNKDGEIERIKADYAFNDKVKGAIRKANGRNEKAIMALLDLETLKASKNQDTDVEAAVATLQKESDYLFGGSTNIPKVVSVTNGINSEAQTKKEQANEAFRSLFGKGV